MYTLPFHRGASVRSTAAQPRPHATFRPEIEGLRAVAVVLVVLDHLVGWPHGGFVGVDVFFVISGFLITGLLVKERDGTGRISIRNFYRRRARRILPAALTVLVVTYVASALVFTASRTREVLTDSLWSGAFLANIHFARTDTDYFNATSAPSPVQHFWSLSVEEQFYIFWPLILIGLFAVTARLAHRHVRVVLAAVTAVLLVGLFVWAVAQTHDNAATAYFLTSARAWELGVGAMLAVLTPYLSRTPALVRTAGLVGGLALIVVSAVTITPTAAFPAPVGAWPVLGAALVIFGAGGEQVLRWAWPLTNPLSRYVGRVSYSLYLWHWPVIIVLSGLIASDSSGFDAVAVLAMSALTIASFHLVESPLRTMRYGTPRSMWRRWRAQRRAAATLPKAWSTGRARAVVVSVALAELAVVAFSLRPTQAPRTFGAFVATDVASAKPAMPGTVAAPAATRAQIASALQATSWPRLSPSIDNLRSGLPPEWQPCGNVGPGQVAKCTYAPRGKPSPASKTAVVLGNSIAIAWLPAVRTALAAGGWTVIGLTYGQCPAADVDVVQQVGKSSDFTRVCNAHRSWTFDEVAKLKPGLVVMGSAENSLERLASGGTGAAAAKEWRAGTTATVDAVRAAGARRVVVLAPPPAGASLEACATKESVPGDCVTSVSEVWHTMVGAEGPAAIAAGAVYIDTERLFCSETEFCPPFIGRTPVRVDGNHITAAVSRTVGKVIATRLRGA